MKKTILFFLSVLICSMIFAQAPDSFNYQAIVRNQLGVISTNTNVLVGISIIQGAIPGTNVYTETHNTATNAFGLINLKIGTGNYVSGNFSAIDWSTGLFFIEISVDGVIMGTTQLLSVPFAKYADKAGNAFSGNYNDLTNKPDLSGFLQNESQILNISNDTIFLTGGSFVKLPAGFNGDYNSLLNTPALSGVATSGNYDDLNNTPDLSGFLQNESQILNISNDTIFLTGGSFVKLPAGMWISNSNNIYNNNSGFVGIGTSNPTSSLHVSGSVRISDDTEGTNKVLTSDSLGNATWQNPVVGSVNGTTNYLPKFSGQNSFDNSMFYQSGNNMGLGTTTPIGKLVVQGDSLSADSVPLFEVKDKYGKTVFVVWPDGVHVYINENAAKINNRGSFAVSGKSQTKSSTTNYMTVNPDSVRIYIDNDPTATSSKKGFAVSGFNSAGIDPMDEFMSITTDSVKVSKSLLIPRMTTFERDNLPFTPGEALIIFNTTDECMEIYKNGVWSNIWCFNCAPNIIIQPTDKTICSGTNVQFNISLTGTSLTYRWQESTDNGDTWNDLSDGGIYSGTNSWTLVLSNVPVSYHLNQYRCKVNASCPPDVTSNIVTLNVSSAPPVFPVNPQDQILSITCEASYHISSPGHGLSYQWQESADGISWNDIADGGSGPTYSGVNTDSLILSSIPLAYNGYYFRCMATNFCSAPTPSDPATITVTPIDISIQPSDQQLSTSCTATFAVSSFGPQLEYQWQESSDMGNTWTNITDGGTGPLYENATTDSLSISNVPLSFDTYKYRCNVSHYCRTPVTSDMATLSVTPITISSQPVNQQISTSCTAYFSVISPGPSLEYQWQESADSGLTWNNVTDGGTSPVYSNTNTDYFYMSNIPMSYSGYQYRCVISHYCRPGITSDAASLSLTPVTISTQPSNQYISAFCSATFSVISSGPSLEYQWQESIDGGSTWNDITDGGSSPYYSNSNTAYLSLSNIPLSYDNYKYRCNINHYCRPGTTSGSASLNIGPPPTFTSQPSNQVVSNTYSATFTFSLSAYGTGIAYQWQESIDGGSTWNDLVNGGSNPTYSGSTALSLTLSNVPLSYNGYMYRCNVSQNCLPSTTSNNASVLFTLPILSTTAISNITSVSGKSGGNITSSGGTAITARGICYSTSPNPTIADSIVDGGTGYGTFTSNLVGLTTFTVYYVRAYATNSLGTAYGNQVSFTAFPYLYEHCLGGVVFYISGQHGLVCAESDLGTSIRWANSGLVTGATGTAIGTGQANTSAIVATHGAGTYAAKLCDDLVLNGFDDWFLPSRYELDLMKSRQTSIGGTWIAWYWSSSECDQTTARLIYFDSAVTYCTSKTGYGPVRAIRAF